MCKANRICNVLLDFGIIQLKIFSMKLTKQILIAFLLPFCSAVGLFLLRDRIFLIGCMPSPEVPGRIICDTPHIGFAIYALVIIGLFILSLLLPPFVSWRALHKKRKILKRNPII